MLRSIWWSLKHSVGAVSKLYSWKLEGSVIWWYGGEEVGVVERTLEDLEVLEVRVLSVDVKLDTCHWDVHVDGVEDLAKSRSIACQYSAPLSHNSQSSCSRPCAWARI